LPAGGGVFLLHGRPPGGAAAGAVRPAGCVGTARVGDGGRGDDGGGLTPPSPGPPQAAPPARRGRVMQDAFGVSRPPRLAVLQLRGLEHFLPDLLAGLAASGAVEVRPFTVTGP